MSNLKYFKYDLSNYELEQFSNFQNFKDKLIKENNEPFLLVDSSGQEYSQDTINQIKNYENNQKQEFVIHYYNSNRNYLFEENTATDMILYQLRIEKILSDYLSKKKSNLEKSKKVCDEILKRAEDFKEDNERINEFVEKYESIFENDKECKKYITMIKCSPKEIDNLLPKFKEIMKGEIDPTYGEVIKKIDGMLKQDAKGISESELFSNKKKLFKDNDKIIKERLLNIINDQELICNMQKKMNETLILGEKINFVLNLSEIPNIYDEISNSKKANLKAEYKRRNHFNYLYEKIMHFIESDLICKEFEYRKNFIKSNFQFSNKTKMEKKSISILNKLIDFEAQKLFLSETELFKSNYELVDSLTRSIDELTEYLNKIAEELFSKKKKDININNQKIPEIHVNQITEEKNDNNNNKFSDPFGEIKQILNNSSVPESKQNNIISIIENKILNQNNTPKTYTLKCSENDEITMSNIEDLSSSGIQNKNSPNAIKIIQAFSKTYGKFLWFYEKVYHYLSTYSEKIDKKNILLNKDDPYSLNNYLISILNDNKSLKEKQKLIRNETY